MRKIFTSIPHISLSKGGKLFGFGTSPETDWKIIFNTGVFLVLCTIIFNAYVFVKIDKGEIFTVNSPEGGSKALDIRKLEEIVSYYKARELEYEEVKSIGTKVPDPSL